MLRICLDSDPQALAEKFLAAVAPASGQVLVPDTILVPTVGTGAWLERLIAERYGIASLLETSLGGRFVWTALQRVISGLPARSPFEPERARWAILAAFDEIGSDQECEPLRSRLAGLDGRERFALAAAVARCFDRYLAFRRDWLEGWEAGRLVGGADPLFMHERWQRWLWLSLLERLPEVSAHHPFEQFRDALEQARRQGGAAAEELGARLATGRIFLFGALGISPEQFRLLAEFASLRDIWWFAPDPSQGFWEDIVSPAQAARLAEEDPAQAWLFESEPAVLGAWGKSQRDFLAQLRMLEDLVEVETDDSFRERTPAALRNALMALQQAVLLLDDGIWQELPTQGPDQSIEVHGAHGEIRQVEILHDRLLDAFETMPGLLPGEVVVYCSDVQRFAPAIDAVFGSAPPERRLPWRIAQRDPRADPAVQALEQLLALARGPRQPAHLLALLDNPVVRNAWRLSDDELEQLALWLAEAGVCSDEEREPEAGKHGWQAGLERLLIGMLADTAVPAVAGRSRVTGPAFGNCAVLERVLEVLEHAATLGGAPRERPPASWARALLDSCEALFTSTGVDVPGLGRIREAVGRVASSAAGLVDTVSFDVLAEAVLAELLSGQPAARAGGAITVCGLGALPGVPFRLTAMLGQDDEAWPRQSPRLEFDLMAAQPRFGDRLARFDDRGAFLDAILATRERLLLLCTTRDARDDSARNPSVPLRELLEYLGRVAPGRISLHQHGLQPFGAAAFDPDSALCSYAAQWLDAAQAVLRSPAARPGLAALADARWRAPPSAATSRTGFAELIQDLASPPRAWCQAALGIRRPAAVRDDETWAPVDPTVQDLARADALVRPVWRGETGLAQLRGQLVDAPWMTAGSGAELTVRLLETLASEMLAARAQVLAESGLEDAPGNSRLLAWDSGAGALSARLDGLHGNALQLLVSAFPSNHRALVDAWLRHALWLAAGGADPQQARTILLTRKDGAWLCEEITLPGEPQEPARHALAWSTRIREEPLALFPRLMRTAMGEQRWRRDSDIDALRAKVASELAAGNAWSSTSADRYAYEILWRAGLPAPDEIVETGLAVYGPIFGAVSAARKIEIGSPGQECE